MNTMGILVAYVIGIALLVALIVYILRWAFRINDIVSRLDNIVELLRKEPLPAKPDLRNLGVG